MVTKKPAKRKAAPKMPTAAQVRAAYKVPREMSKRKAVRKNPAPAAQPAHPFIVQYRHPGKTKWHFLADLSTIERAKTLARIVGEAGYFARLMKD